MFDKKVKVRSGRHVTDFSGDQVRSTLALTTNLPANTINEILSKVNKKLSKLEQPIVPHDIATTTHFVMVEMGLKTEGDKYMRFIKDRRDGRKVRKVKITFINCESCGISNDPKHNFCVNCGNKLDKRKTESKIV
jgi:uncharacterized paraquat-inducible protein A